MSTEPKRRRRLSPADVYQAMGLVFVTSGAWVVSPAVGLVTAGVAFLWIGWSQA
jgi:hypothetical protein